MYLQILQPIVEVYTGDINTAMLPEVQQISCNTGTGALPNG